MLFRSHPEIIVLPIASEDGWIKQSAIKDVQAYIDTHKFDVLAVGPGIGREDSTQVFVRDLLQINLTIPVVLDADGLNAVDASFLKTIKSKIVLTPHPKEYEKVFNDNVTLLETDEERKEAIKKAVNTSNKIVVLKGHHTLVASSDNIYLNKSGNAGMATAGTGDVLTGLISGFIAQGVEPFDAAVLGTYSHGLSGEIGRAHV